MDSAVRAGETRYQGWFVDSKQLGDEQGDPIYIIGVIAAGQVGTRAVVVDGDSTSYWREHRRRHYRPATYP